MEAFNGKIKDFSHLISILVGLKFVSEKYFWRGKYFPKQHETKTYLADESRFSVGKNAPTGTSDLTLGSYLKGRGTL